MLLKSRKANVVKEISLYNLTNRKGKRSMKEYLLDEILPFWLENAIDEEYGGIFTCLDERGNI